MSEIEKLNQKQQSERDHDLLTRVDANVANIAEWFKEHIKDDAERFKHLDDRTGRLERFMYIATGVVLIVEALARWVK